jgi:two-component system cell cycle response regulator
MARILVIEDNPASLELITYLLSAFGHTPLMAVDGAAGIAAARDTLPDLVLCDVQLPGMDGFAVAAQLKADPALRSIPLVAVTALAMVGDRDQILTAGFDGYLAKPIVPETFVEQVEAFLAPAQRTEQAPALAAPSGATEAASTSAGTRATILIVDDRSLNHELMRSILEPSGYTVVIAASVREGLALARERPPQLIVSDMHMPEQDGFDLLRAIKADPLLRRLKVMIHSATIGSDQDCQEALRLGALRCITRLAEPQMILAEIESCLNEEPERHDGDDPHP